MGGKQPRRRQHVFLYTALWAFIVSALTGCAGPVRSSFDKDPSQKMRAHLVRGEADAALAANEKQIFQSASAHRDRALFERGMIYCHPANPEQEYAAARRTFEGLIENYPHTAWRTEAETMLYLLQRNDRLQISLEKRDADDALRRQRLEEMTDENERLRERVKKLRKETLHLTEHARHLEDQLEQLKDVDLGIEEKKRELSTE